ncbi:polynucleotide 5'-hydroxyl-kinase NOL9 [Diachasma alloeum]|uniref:polynucleotide 5'-hydroxyl-kinase NOL9 n=1 Tax=Diachasma alloeum TaxID=454923 RepID=UPI0007381468|nr:polynucleotide 5'-hydroxyl-kinase NOL9 [Diachasma alloeum]
MKIQKLKSRPSNEFQILDGFEVEENVDESMIIEEAPLNEDWQTIEAVGHEHRICTSKKAKRSSLKRKAVFNPVAIKQSAKALLCTYARSLFPNVEESTTRRKNKILRDFLTNEPAENPPATITTCRTIVPDEIRQKKRRRRNKKIAETSESKPPDSEEQSDPDVSINLNDTSHQNESSLSHENPADWTLDTSQIPEASQLPHFYSLRDKVICVIEPESRFSFQGKLRVQVLYGAVKVYGAVLNKENTDPPVEIYSSRGTSLVFIESAPQKNSGNIADVWTALSNDNIDQNITNDLQRHVNSLEAGWAVVRLQNLENNLTNFLGNFSTHRLFPKLDDVSNYSWSDPKRAEVVLQANVYSGSAGKQTIGFRRTDGTFEEISKRCVEDNSGLRIVLAGGKNVGKSTTGRYFVNKLLETFEAVVFVDLDIGQAEFTPPGCISLNVIKRPLLGPNFTHLKAPYHQLYVGGVDASKYLTNYIEGVRQLTEFLNECEEVRGLPVVVNTMGFCRGLGWDIMCCVVKRLRPTDVVQITSKNKKNNYDQLLACELVNRQNPTWKGSSIAMVAAHPPLNYELHVVDTEAESRNPTEELWNIEPYQQREIVMLAYLSDILKPKRGLQDFTSINEVVPYEVPFSAVSISLGTPVVPQILSVMNGNIVAMCGIDSQNENTEPRKVGYPKVMIRAPPSVCHGFGILRGVDMTNEKLYINTPLSLSKLKHVNCLIGALPVPSGLLQLSSPGLPYVGDNPELPTSRDSRRGYFRMRHRHDISI